MIYALVCDLLCSYVQEAQLYRLSKGPNPIVSRRVTMASMSSIRFHNRWSVKGYMTIVKCSDASGISIATPNNLELDRSSPTG